MSMLGHVCFQSFIDGLITFFLASKSGVSLRGLIICFSLEAKER